MNERLKELWEESTGSTIPAEGFYSSASTYNIEKFAELLLKESFEVIVKSQRGHMNPKTARDALKEHFGVEE